MLEICQNNQRRPFGAGFPVKCFTTTKSPSEDGLFALSNFCPERFRDYLG